jgi:hypothetical protein
MPLSELQWVEIQMNTVQLEAAGTLPASAVLIATGISWSVRP